MMWRCLYTVAMSAVGSPLLLSWLSGQQHLDLRVIVDAPPGTGFSVIQPTELTDPREFLHPQAVVLTVGMALAREVDPFPDYVARLAESQVSAIGFGTGLFYPDVPTDLVEAARTHGISVIEVPRHTAFIAILNAVAAERARQATREQERLIAVQELLSAAAVRGGMDALLAETASHLNCAVAVTDNDGRLHGHVDPTGPAGSLSAVEEGRRATRSGAGQRDGVWRISQRMTPQGERVHLITVVADHPFTPHDRSVLKHAAGLADILLQRPAYLRQARTELNSLALRVQLGLDSAGLSTGHILDGAADGAGRVRPVVVAADRAADLRRALAEADRGLAVGGRHLYSTPLNTATSVFLFRGSRPVADVAATFGASAAKLRIAVGEPVAWNEVTLERVHRLETAARSMPPGSAAGPYETGTAWLQDAAVRSALDVRASETLDRLVGAGDGDASEGRELLQTLETWLRSGGKTAVTAEALGVHRHTVRTRLTRIAEICEVDLDDPVARAELLLVAVTRQ